ncbi:MAG: methylenetetrahydrofolate--tRNA-(uracil(54)-C(5))-methyltransferase (FADH(2)-oxidizing) TrmFO [Chloroflexi bacterium HGW-Chloroflexi-6]|nr:MAG: methylenetetrahydrofolate--tRNA-(uracil(54)-C(5))-methyltransferase (FADH(2)-oxidizing) TrmFO [Chloroflexi bacterium HGW-Chloroflexi-6]
MQNNLIIIGGGLAGSEAAWQAAQRDIKVRLYEMRPVLATGAHQTPNLAELVCSNSLGSNLPDRASGVLKAELRRLGSLLLDVAEETALPAGAALAVDRERFAEIVTERISAHPNIELIRAEMPDIPSGPAIIASGPLTSARLSQALAQFSGEQHLYFYDAIAPIVEAGSINMNIAYRASRWDEGEQSDGDYINCPFHLKSEYLAFVEALRTAERIELRDFEKPLESGVTAGHETFFEGCLPVEIIANRGEKALAYGPMRPVGLNDPRVARRPYAVVQLRQDNLAGNLYNLVGFQTNLTFPEQRRVLRLIPGLEQAEFVRYGQMHRNTFLASPKILLPTLQTRARADLFLAGQITGVEGYMGNIATGLLAGQNAARLLRGETPLELPRETMLGALCHYVTHADLKDFQPMKSNFGILPALENAGKAGKRERAALYAERASSALDEFMQKIR